MVTSIDSELKSLEKTKNSAIQEKERAAMYESPLDGDDDLDSVILKLQQVKLISEVDSELGREYGVIERIWPRSKTDAKIVPLVKLKSVLKTNTSQRKKKTDLKEKSPLANTAFISRAEAKNSWSTEKSVPDKIPWKVQFRCIKPDGHKESWVVLDFDPESFKEWWWKGREELFNKETYILDDVRTLARKVLYLTTYADMESMQRSLVLSHLKRVAEKAKESVLTVHHLIQCYTIKRDRILVVFEVIVPLAFVASKTALNALEIAESGLWSNAALNSRLENHLHVIEALSRTANNFLRCLQKELQTRPSSFVTTPGIDEVQGDFSPAVVYEMSDAICFQQMEVGVANNHSSDVHQLRTSERELSTAHGGSEMDLSFFANLNVPQICVRRDVSEFIGEGSFGEVYKMGASGDLGVCAVKKLKEGTKNRLEKEVTIWSRLQHRNVLPLLGYTILEFSSLPALVSPFCMNNLKLYLQDHRNKPYDKEDRSSKFPEYRILEFIDDIAGALKYLHSEGIAHGDLRAVNVLVRETEDCSSVYAVLCDFGISKSIVPSDKARTTRGQGTNEAWLSPELMVANEGGSRVSKAGDIWAFGCVFLEVQYGTDPFENVPYAPVELLVSKSLPAKKEGLVGLRDSHWDLMSKCWRFYPEERPEMPRISLEVKKLMKEVQE